MLDANSDQNTLKANALALATQHWGWSAPPEAVLEMAELSINLKKMPSGEAAVYLNLISAEEKEALLAKKPHDIPTLEWLGQHRSAVKNELDKIMALRSGVQHIEFDLLRIGIQVQSHPDMSKEAVRRNCEIKRCVLLQIEKTTPVLCFSTYADYLRYDTGGRAERNQLLSLMTKPIFAIGNQQRVTELIAASGSNSQSADDEKLNNVWLAIETRDDGALRRFSALLDAAMSTASDIDIHPSTNGQGRIMFRVNGAMQDPHGGEYNLSASDLVEITNFLAKKSGANIHGTRILSPLDGQLIYRSAAGEIFIRASFIPLNPAGTSFDMVSVDLRLFQRTEVDIDLHKLNMRPDVIAECEKTVRHSQGMVIVVGPTNSGKSTTLAGMICLHSELYADTLKRISLENPVERILRRIKQIHVSDKEQFGNIFEKVLRHDPDLIMVGEIRDEFTADTAVDASLSGHLVLSSLHANDTLVGFRRLTNMIDAHKRFDLIESLELIISQRLVKLLCPKCNPNVTRSLTPDEIKRINEYSADKGIEIPIPDQVPMEAPGCEYCQNTGYSSLAPIHEVLPMTRTLKNLLASGRNSFEDMAGYRTRTLVSSALELVTSGQTTIDRIFI
jgi:type IV pilus assembly protein PilB